MPIIKQIGKWYNTKHVRGYIYDTERNKLERLDLKQSRCSYDPEKKIAMLQYFTDGNKWLSEQHAKIQIQKFLRSHVTKNRMLISVDNQKSTERYGLTSRVQISWLSPAEPAPETLEEIAERICQLPETAPIQVDEMNYYERRKLTGATIGDDGKPKMEDDDYINDAQKRGFF